MNEIIPLERLSSKGRNLFIGILFIMLLIIAIGLFGYFSFPEKVPTHFGIDGKPDKYGDKIAFLFLPLILCLGPILILIIVKFRFTLINKYPYLVNLPGFFININKIEFSKRGYWVNKYFELTLWLGLFLSFYLLFIMIMIYYSTMVGEFPVLVYVLVIVFPLLMVVPFFVALSNLSNQMKKEVNGYK